MRFARPLMDSSGSRPSMDYFVSTAPHLCNGNPSRAIQACQGFLMNCSAPGTEASGQVARGSSYCCVMDIPKYSSCEIPKSGQSWTRFVKPKRGRYGLEHPWAFTGSTEGTGISWG